MRKKLTKAIDAGAVLDRHKVRSYSIHQEPLAGTIDISISPYELSFNREMETLMISGKSVKHPQAEIMEDWAGFNRDDLHRLGIDAGWWSQNKAPILEIINLLTDETPEPPAAVEDPEAQVDPAPPIPTDDDLHKLQAVVDVTLRGVAQHATA